MTAMPASIDRLAAVRILLSMVLALLLLALAGNGGQASAAESVATGARIGGDETRTRFVADLTRPVSYTVYVLPDPYRGMIALPGVQFDLPPDAGRNTRGLIGE